MTRLLHRSAVGVLLLSAMAVGCSGSPELPPVPPIADTRDADGADPCALLTQNQLVAFGLGGVAQRDTSEAGPRCRWSSGGGELEVTLYTGGGGLATLAENSEPTTTRVRLAGYPALETFTGRGEFCQYDVGVAEKQVISASLDASRPGSCDLLQRVVPALVATLPAGGPG
jgi:hypothetical protein